MMNILKKQLDVLLILIIAITQIIPVSMTSYAGNNDSHIEGELVMASSEKIDLEEASDVLQQHDTYNGKNAKRIPVITYHMVVTDKQKRSRAYRGTSLAISKSKFNRQMKWLHDKGYRTISCEELYLWYTGRIKLPKKSVLITFDDGHIGVADNALPILRKYNMKGTVFIIGNRTYKNRKNSISHKRMLQIQESYPNMEFQSHTYGRHNHAARRASYEKILKDAEKQKKIFAFEYLAYPYGKYSSNMIKAYKKSGIKLAFTYGKNDYATRRQNIYKIRRIKIYGNGSFSSFKRWFK